MIARPTGAIAVYGAAGMLFDQERHGRAIKVMAIILAVVFLIGMVVLGGILLFV